MTAGVGVVEKPMPRMGRGPGWEKEGVSGDDHGGKGRMRFGEGCLSD